MNLPETITKLYEDGTIVKCPLHRSRGRLSPERRAARVKVLTERGKMEKTFEMDFKTKRKIKSSAIRLFHQRKNSIKWFTLTFTVDIDPDKANECLSKFIDNLNKNYNANDYVIVKELTKIGRPHYHCLIDLPFKSFGVLNNSWCNACRDVMPYSVNALTSGKKKIIDDIRGVINYIAKYISKAEQISKTRIVFISGGCLPRPAVIDYNNYIYLTTAFQCKTVVSDYFTITFLKNFAYLPEMFLIQMQKKRKPPPKIKVPSDLITPNLLF